MILGRCKRDIFPVRGFFSQAEEQRGKLCKRIDLFESSFYNIYVGRGAVDVYLRRFLLTYL